MIQKIVSIQDRTITIETGEIAKQANGAVLIKQLDTVVLVAIVADESQEETDFFPLTVEYREKASAAGRIPGGFVKRETRPSDHEILTSRLIDRSIRPLFPHGFMNEVQVMATVLSFDPKAAPEPIAILGAAAALHISDIPWNGPMAGVSLIQKDEKYILLPTMEEQQNAKLDMVVSCSRQGVVMMEGLAQEVPDREIVKAIEVVQQSLNPFLDILDELQQSLNVKKRELPKTVTPEGICTEIRTMAKEPLLNAMVQAKDKKERHTKIREVCDQIIAVIGEKYPEYADNVPKFLEEIQYDIFRQYMISQQKRIDGRSFVDIRPISGKTGWLPRTHGSSLFTRGETQAIVTCTLGIGEDEQIIDTLSGEERQRFFLHYNFPSYSVGEVKAIRGPGRREIGHGNLATRALQHILPSHTDFPYTIRLVSDITESNGSSSMATVCGGCLALMDAGVPIKKPVAGVAMGMLQEGEHNIIISDIMGDEDHLGDMDFKVAGTNVGITAVQMDNKIGSLPSGIMERALEQAFQARLHILKEMEKILPQTRRELAPFAPRVFSLNIRKERIRDLIGPGGKNIQEIQEHNKVRIDVDQTGWVRIYSSNSQSAQEALKQVDYLTKELEIGKIYRGIVTNIKNFGAFVRIFANTEGLLHISEIGNQRIDKITDVLKEGDEVIVKVMGVDRQGKIRLSRKETLHVHENEIVN